MQPYVESCAQKEMNLLPILGFAGGLCLTAGCLPVALEAFRCKRSDIPISLSACFLLGLVLSYAYLHASRGYDPVVLIMYSIRIPAWLVVLKYSLWPRKCFVVRSFQRRTDEDLYNK